MSKFVKRGYTLSATEEAGVAYAEPSVDELSQANPYEAGIGRESGSQKTY